ncbi:hypothetical protein RUND412_002320 [Rhizina undulata]
MTFRTLLRPTSMSKPTTAAFGFTFIPPSRLLSTYIVSPRDLHSALATNPPSTSTSPRIIPVSAEWFLPNDPHTGESEFRKLRIPTARFFDLDKIKDEDSPYPHMLPTKATFSKAIGKLGIRREDTVVVYDSPALGIFSAPRAAWTFKVFGHEKVHLLNNFKAWVEEGLPVESGEAPEVKEVEYVAEEPDLGLVVGFEEMVDVARGPKDKVQILDARPKGRFLGVNPEPREGLSSGHVPGAISVAFSELVDPVTKKLRSGPELREILLEKGVDPSEDVEKKLMCGTGVTAVVIDAALELAEISGKRRVYDGSWTEWAQRATAEEGLIVKEDA